MNRSLGLLALGFAAFFPMACGTVTGVEEPDARLEASGRDAAGSASIRIALGSVALRKAAAPAGAAPLAKKADTTVTLDTLHLVFTSPGCPARTLGIPVSGDVNAASPVLAARMDGLLPLRNWKVTAFTRDESDSVMHIDSTTFYVRPADTAAVTMLLVPRYSVLVARFVSTSNRVSQIEKLVLKVNGEIVDDTTFSSRRKTFDVILSHKYVKAGIPATLDLEAHDRSGNESLRYSRSLTLTPRASGDSVLTVQLN